MYVCENGIVSIIISNSFKFIPSVNYCFAKIYQRRLRRSARLVGRSVVLVKLTVADDDAAAAAAHTHSRTIPWPVTHTPTHTTAAK